MNKRVELPLIEPLYSTYHNQGAATAIVARNQTILNWYYNNVMNLICGKRFFNGFSSPEIGIQDSSWVVNPYLVKERITTQFTKGYINPIIREMLNNGYYVAFGYIDDYYIKGKSWYKEKHFAHDGLICGYDQDDKTYCVYSYDSDWKYRKFWTPQKGFDQGRIYMEKKGVHSVICGLKVTEEKIEFSTNVAYEKIKEYLDSSMEKYPICGHGCVYGIVVHEYISEYIMRLYSGIIPYERMDRRVFRVIWEHKKVMLERVRKIEEFLQLGDEISKKYVSLVAEADTMRLLYASHHMKRRDALLLTINKKLLDLMNNEKELLTLFVKKIEEES